jgi:pyruvate,water dikinase
VTEPEPRLIIHFSAIEEGDQPLVGGKAYSLAELARSGAPVPPGFALTTRALEVFLAQGTIEAERERIEERVRKGDLSLKQSWELLGETRAKIVSSPLPPEVRSALVASYEGLLGPNVPVAVRSSGTKEDLEGASFAGQYETFLNVRGEEALIRAVKRCWASIWRNRVLQYAARRAGGALDLGMSVVVQEMVDAEVSGVLFTLNPLTGAENEVLIESVFGLGESLVSGKVDADRFCVDHQRKVVTERSIATKALRIVALPPGQQEVSATGGVDYTHEEPLTGEAADAPTLDDAGLLELAELARCVQSHYGQPMDVEWVRAQDRTLFAVQARPVTAISFPSDFGEWTTADFKDGGVSSDVCSPLMWSLYEAALEQSMPGYFKEIGLLAPDHEAKWGRIVFARPYWNLAEVKAVLEKIPGYNERSFDADLGVAIPYEGDGKTTPTTLGGLARALPVLFKLNKSYKRVLAHDRSLKEEFETRKAPFDQPAEAIARLTDPEFNKRFRELLIGLYIETETSYFTTIYNTSNSKLDFKVHFDKVNKLMGGDLDYPTLVSGLTDLAHLRPQIDMHARLGALRKAEAPVTDEVARSFADRWPHKSRKELDLRVPRWKDDVGFRESHPRAVIGRLSRGGRSTRAGAEATRGLRGRALARPRSTALPAPAQAKLPQGARAGPDLCLVARRDSEPVDLRLLSGARLDLGRGASADRSGRPENHGRRIHASAGRAPGRPHRRPRGRGRARKGRGRTPPSPLVSKLRNPRRDRPAL